VDEHEFFRLITSLSSAIHIAYDGSRKSKCPHCGIERDIPILKLEQIVICQCERCKEYVIPFAGMLLPIGKSIVENHTNEAELHFAIVQVIMKELYSLVRRLVYRGLSEDPIDPNSLPNTVEDLLDE